MLHVILEILCDGKNCGAAARAHQFCSLSGTRTETPPVRYDFNSFFDPVSPRRQTKSEVYAQSEYPESPIQKERATGQSFMTCAEINSLIERLTAPKVSHEQKQKAKKQAESTARLFQDSIRKPEKVQPKASTSSICDESRMIAEKRIKKEITDAFGDELEVSKQRMQQIFVQLGIIESGEDINWREIYRDIMEDWQVDENLYDAVEAKVQLLEAIDGDRSSRFKRTARKKMMVKFMNKREPRLPEPEPEETYTGSSVISQDVFDRIIAPRPKPEYVRPEHGKVDLSEMSRRVCDRSVFGKKGFFKRGEFLERRRLERINRVSEESKPREYLRFESTLTEEDVQRIEERKKERQKRIVDEVTPSFKPSTIKYQEYLKRKKKVTGDRKNPAGYENNVKRHRVAHQLYLEKKEADAAPVELPLPVVKKADMPEKKMTREQYLLMHPPQRPVTYG